MNKTKAIPTKRELYESALYKVETARNFMRYEEDADGPFEMDLWYAMESLKRAVNELAQMLEEETGTK